MILPLEPAFHTLETSQISIIRNDLRQNRRVFPEVKTGLILRWE
jgi:hypothetical protein